MCEYCDERGLPCLMCGRACMEYQMDRSRCKGCAQVNSPPRVWPIFTFCPYCGRNLNEDKNEEQEDMSDKYVWTAEADTTIRRMIDEGASRVDICDALGCTDKQLNNRLCVLRRQDSTFPRLARGCHRTAACAEAEAVAVAEDPENPSLPSPSVSELFGSELADDDETVARITRREAELVEFFEDKLKEREVEIDRMTRELERLRTQADVFTELIDSKQQQLDAQEHVIAAMAMELYGG